MNFRLCPIYLKTIDIILVGRQSKFSYVGVKLGVFSIVITSHPKDTSDIANELGLNPEINKISTS